jgi:hypothetical protein
VLAGLEETDTLPFGGYLPVVSVDDDVKVLATFIPDFPIYPPETSWMRQPYSDVPAITVRENGKGKFVWFVADLDRCYARDDQFEHARLITNAARWMLGDHSLLRLEGTHGLVTAALYQQDKRQIVHLNNRVLISRVPGRQNELVPIGPVTLRLRKPAGKSASDASLRVAGKTVKIIDEGSEIAIDAGAILDHEVIIVDWS